MNVQCENPYDMAEKIVSLIEDAALRDRFGHGARRCAEEKFNRACSYLEIMKTIEG